MANQITVGAVVYAPQVTVVWKIISDYFKKSGMDMKCTFFKNYRDQTKAILNGDVDVAWDSPLAYVEQVAKSDGKVGYSYMRDTDRDRTSCFLARVDSNINGFEDMRGKTIGFGAVDSPQARLIPIETLHEQGLEYGHDYVEHTFDIDVGLDGDHEGGEGDALAALKKGEVDVSLTAAGNYKAWKADGTIDPSQIKLVGETGLYDHCIFATRPDLPQEIKDQWEDLLGKMDYNNPEHKEMMDLEGLKKWIPGRTSGFELVSKAVKYLNFDY